MLTLLRKMRFKWKLVLMISIPLICLIGVSSQEVARTSSIKQETTKILQLAELSVVSSRLVHELQKERGMSAGYLSSGGTKFVTKLPDQRKLTDEKASEFAEKLAVVKGGLGADIDALLEKSEADMASLPTVRSQVTNLQLTTAEEVAIYTAMNKHLIDVIAFLPHFSSIGDVNNLATAYVSFIQSKERAGIERAVLAGTFAKDRFVPGSFLKLNTLIVEQDTYFRVFRSLANSTQLSDFDAMHKETPFLEAGRLRNLALEKADTGGFNVDPESWFSIQTDKINLLKQYENALSDNVILQVGETNQSAAQAFNFALAATVASILISLIVGWLMFRLIMWQLGADPERLRNLTWQISHDNLDVSFGEEDRKLSGVYASLRMMRDKLREQILSEREAAAGENARIKRALDNASNNLALVGKSLEIQYMNKAMSECLARMQPTLREAFGDIPENDLLERCIGEFSEEGSQVVEQIKSEKIPREMTMRIGSGHFRILLSPVLTDDGEKTGSVIEWQDRTEQVLTEDRIHEIIKSAKSGDLGRRVETAGMHGFFAYLAGSVNELLDETERAVSDTGRAVGAMARGDLTASIAGEYRGSFGELKTNVNSTIQTLTEVVGKISDSADMVTRRSDEISDGTGTISQRTEMQAANLEETASSMEEMTSIVRQNAESALQANRLAADARVQAEEGGQVVNEAIKAMSEITESSEQISAIIGVIDEIAFQTNLLALNASVEAARAGDQGRGFAVVASEVRNLAGRSANAAREIKELINESVEKIHSGSALVGNSGETLEQIVAAVNQVVEIVNNISSASQEQSQGIEQVNRSVAQIDQTTQENAGMVEETAMAAKAMRDQANNLKELVGFFRMQTQAGTMAGSQLKVVNG